LGHARTFLIAWLAARSTGGSIILRIEDLDATRVRAEAAATAIADLKWLGLDWDSGPFFQSQRGASYEEALGVLKDRELVYPCTCTRADIERAAAAPHEEDEGPTYPATCAGRNVADADSLGDRPFAWRFRVPQGNVSWNDLFLGRVERDPARLGGDFPVSRNRLGPSYQLAVVVDDAMMGVNQVIRADDLVPSTPRQILLYQAFGFPPPQFGHVPLAVTPDGRRLAKRDGSIKLETLREQGALPRALIGMLARSCGWSRTIVPSWPSDWISRFDPGAVPGEPWVVRDLL
jgi:glutamyl-tRNA synthetase